MASVAQGAEQIGTDGSVVLDEQQVGHGCTLSAAASADALLYLVLGRAGHSLIVRPGIVGSMTTQRLIIAAGWLAAAVLAVLVGVIAVSVIGDGLTGSAGRPLAESEVARRLAAAPEESTTPAPPEPSPRSQRDTETKRTPGGTVVADCVDGAPEIVSMSPAQGFNVHEWDRGPQRGDSAEGEFRGQSNNHDRVKVHVRCGGDTPDVEVEHENRDD
ncbi:hypothetical protein Acsp02_07700 [Actinoplanes sp. NBRC 103695]|nr:hypothetical protein Acsp02_07700 [Actinoplanes sp. NBRC 103695]